MKIDEFIRHFGIDENIEIECVYGIKTTLKNILKQYEKEVVKNCSIPNVVNRRELLTAFYRSLEGGDYLYPEECDMYINNFESGL